MNSTPLPHPHPMTAATPPLGDSVKVMTLAQLSRGSAWRLNQIHSEPNPLFIWTTRGQGRVTLDGIRSGLGAHNALLIPANTLFALDIGKQGFGLAVHIPLACDVSLPQTAQHLRIRDVLVQGELTTILEALQREHSGDRPFCAEAATAYAQILSVWLRRAMIETSASPRISAAERLVKTYAAMVAREYQTGRPMADYAEALNVTPTHLTRTCKHCSGLTAADILTERSLYAARDLLETTQTPINQISDLLGFGSAAYFTRFIQHHTGKTPSDLRRGHPNDANARR